MVRSKRRQLLHHKKPFKGYRGIRMAIFKVILKMFFTFSFAYPLKPWKPLVLSLLYESPRKTVIFMYSSLRNHGNAGTIGSCYREDMGIRKLFKDFWSLVFLVFVMFFLWFAIVFLGFPLFIKALRGPSLRKLEGKGKRCGGLLKIQAEDEHFSQSNGSQSAPSTTPL